jgi:cell division septation protein DedD
MTTLLRGAHKIRAKVELTLDGRRIALIAATQIALLGGAFAVGWTLASGRAPAATAPPVSQGFRDPLEVLDEDVPRVDYTYHQRLTSPREAPVEKAPSASPGAATPSRPKEPIAPPRRDADGMRALEERARTLVASSARRSLRGSRPATRGETDDELREAMREGPPLQEAKKAKEAKGSEQPKKAREPEQPKKPRVSLDVGPPALPGTKPRLTRGPATPAAGPKSTAARGGRFTLQIRAFQEREKAEELVEHLRQRGLEAYLTEGEVPGRGRWYRVRVGRFSTREGAQEQLQRLEAQEKVSAIVTMNR